MYDAVFIEFEATICVYAVPDLLRKQLIKQSGPGTEPPDGLCQ